jgi:hypothetical protein
LLLGLLPELIQEVAGLALEVLASLELPDLAIEPLLVGIPGLAAEGPADELIRLKIPLPSWTPCRVIAANGTGAMSMNDAPSTNRGQSTIEHKTGASA